MEAGGGPTWGWCSYDPQLNLDYYGSGNPGMCNSAQTPSGIIGNVFTYRYGGKHYVGVYSGIGGWAGVGMAARLTEPTAGLGAVRGYKDLARYTTLGGSLFVFALPDGDNATARR